MLIKKLIALAAVLLAGSAAFSQIHKTESSDSLRPSHSYNLNPVVVTGSGHHQRLKSTATPVHVLSAQEISNQGITTFDQALMHIMPQVAMAPSSMGSFLRLNGLAGKYILILVNGQKLSGDISNNIDLNRINMARVKRIEVLDGAASSLYGSDAIAGVINIITDIPSASTGAPSAASGAPSAATDVPYAATPLQLTTTTHITGSKAFTQSATLDIQKNGFGSYTSFAHEQADSYRTTPLEYVKGSHTETQPSIAPLFTGYHSNLIAQQFTYNPTRQLALNASLDYSYKITDRPPTNPSVTGGTDYEMRYKGLRWSLGGIYKFNASNSLQAQSTTDRSRYGKEYDVETKDIPLHTYIQSKKQRATEANVKTILHLSPLTPSTTILGAQWRKDRLNATSGNIDQSAYTLAAYAQHEQPFSLGPGTMTAVAGLRYDYHQNFSSRLTPKATLMYSLGHFNLRATYSAGFRAPGLDELYYHYYSVNRGKPQISFGDQSLKPEKSNYFALNAEYRTPAISVSITASLNRINDIILKQNIPVDDAETLLQLMHQFPEITQDQAGKIVSYARYQNCDKAVVKAIKVNLSANPLPGLNLSANYVYTYARSNTGQEWVNLERSIRHAATIAANYHHTWRRYTLNVNLNGRLQSKTYYNGNYENAPGFGVWNLNTTHTLHLAKWARIQPSIGIDNIFDRVDRRIDSPTRKFALYSPGRMFVMGLKVNLL